jgi:hypothetical protein
MALEHKDVRSGEQFEFGRSFRSRRKAARLRLARHRDASLAGLDSRMATSSSIAVATDARPGEGTARSDAFSSRSDARGRGWRRVHCSRGRDAHALSQQMLIIKTDRAERNQMMAPAEFTDAALNFAVEQRMIRAEFVFMLEAKSKTRRWRPSNRASCRRAVWNRGQRTFARRRLP